MPSAAHQLRDPVTGPSLSLAPIERHQTRPAAPAEPLRNVLLAALPHEEQVALERSLEWMVLQSDTLLHEPGAPIEHVYFPEGALVAFSLDGYDEPLTVGDDGLVGVSALLSAPCSPGSAVVRIPGPAARIGTDALIRARSELPALHAVLEAHVHDCLLQLARSATCSRFHHTRPRLAALLLRLREQAGTSRLPLTHERLARILGVARRASVTDAMAVFRAQELIEISRGEVVIRDADGLAELACPCHERLPSRVA